MSRRAQAPHRTILPDPKFGSDMLAKFINMVMESGKKSVAEKHRLRRDRPHRREDRPQAEPLELLEQALDNVKPMVEVKSRRVGGATYQVPVEVRATRRQTLAMRWVIEAAREPQREVDGAAPRRRAARRRREPRRRRQASAKTRTAWPKPTRRSRTTAGECPRSPYATLAA